MSDSKATQYNVDNVYRAFSNLIDETDTESIDLHRFIMAFRELSKFFDHLNIVFSFIVHDLVDKFQIIESLYKNNPIHYNTIQTMVAYEKSKDEKTGTIALLRLLRALEFLYLFLEGAIFSPSDCANTKQIAWDVYKQTLHKRHNKAIQATVWLATATIPKRDVLKQIILIGEIEPNTPDKCFPLIANVYRDIYKLYEDNNLLELVPL